MAWPNPACSCTTVSTWTTAAAQGAHAAAQHSPHVRVPLHVDRLHFAGLHQRDGQCGTEEHVPAAEWGGATSYGGLIACSVLRGERGCGAAGCVPSAEQECRRLQ